MKQSLQLKISQQLTMTPQMQQAIRLLQLSTIDLQQEIQTMVENNPMLELSDDEVEGGFTAEQAKHEGNELTSESTATSNDDQPDYAQELIPNELPVDSQWEDIYPTQHTTSQSMNNDDIDTRTADSDTLQDHLRWQLNLTPMSDTDCIIALAIIDAVDTKGFLSTTAEDIQLGLTENIDVELEEVLAVLHLIQRFDPLGVAAQDLRDCLLIQLQQLPTDTPWLAPAIKLVEDHLHTLGSHDFSLLKRRLRLKDEQLSQVIALIQTLHPLPGDIIAESPVEYITPDVFVRKVGNRWSVELNPEVAPRLRINTTYAGLIKRADNSPDNSYMRDNLLEARWFLKSLHSRNETLMKVASRIVEVQQGFLEYGEEAMKPLILHDIAEAIDMHESTISRVTTNKYMHTPTGVFELKYFFSSHVGTDSGGECSSTAIRAIIKKLVAAENPKKPLSDNKITQLLADRSITVARRTIAKYRETLGIPPSNERKRLV
jgi:RNA polymerase sigma-54 factor